MIVVYDKRIKDFKNWCLKNGIKRFLFDLDDTICPTRSNFNIFISQAIEFIANANTSLSKEKWKSAIEKVNNKLFEQVGVTANRWNLVMDDLANRYTFDPSHVKEAKRIFQLIYQTPLGFIDGAEEGLSFVRQTDMPIGVVTHASVEWTKQKYEWLNLSRFLKWEDVFVVNENGHKTSKEWAEAINHFGLHPIECAVVGDSPRSDINPTWNLGVKHCFLVEDPGLWSVLKEPIHPDVKIIKNLAQIPNIILENFS